MLVCVLGPERGGRERRGRARRRDAGENRALLKFSEAEFPIGHSSLSPFLSVDGRYFTGDYTGIG